jgi:predicted nuclease with TOPRIM domain
MELKKAYPDLDLNWLYTGIYSDENVAFEKVFVPESDVLKENERLKSELQELRSELSETKQEKRKLFDLLGKHESETESLFVDTEQGIDLMNWILYSQSGFALSERLN